MQRAYDLVAGRAETLAEAGPVMRAAVLNGVSTFGCPGHADLFTLQLEYHEGVGLDVVLELGFAFEYFDPMVSDGLIKN